MQDAETRRTPRGKAEAMLSGYVALAVHNRALVAVLAADPSVATALQGHPDWRELIGRQLGLLAAVDAGSGGEIKAAMLFAGIAGAVGPMRAEHDDDALYQHLVNAGRRALGLRAPRRTTDSRGKEHTE